MIKRTKALLLAGASALAILTGAAEANAVTFDFSGTETTYTVPVTGAYEIIALGAQGGSGFGGVGGAGAGAAGSVELTAGTVLTILVGGQGGYSSSGGGGGGGGGSFVFDASATLIAA